MWNPIFFSRFAKKIFLFDYWTRTLPYFLANIRFPKPSKRCHYYGVWGSKKPIHCNTRKLPSPLLCWMPVEILAVEWSYCAFEAYGCSSFCTVAGYWYDCESLYFCLFLIVQFFLGLFNHIFGIITITFWIIWWCSEKLRCIRNVSTNNNGRSG